MDPEQGSSDASVLVLGPHATGQGMPTDASTCLVVQSRDLWTDRTQGLLAGRAGVVSIDAGGSRDLTWMADTVTYLVATTKASTITVITDATNDLTTSAPDTILPLGQAVPTFVAGIPACSFSTTGQQPLGTAIASLALVAATRQVRRHQTPRGDVVAESERHLLDLLRTCTDRVEELEDAHRPQTSPTMRAAATVDRIARAVRLVWMRSRREGVGHTARWLASRLASNKDNRGNTNGTL